MEEKRTGFIGIVVEKKENVSEVNRILSLFGDMILGRIGVPNKEDGTAVIGLIVEGNNDKIGSMTGKLGSLDGIVVKSAMTKKKEKGEIK